MDMISLGSPKYSVFARTERLIMISVNQRRTSTFRIFIHDLGNPGRKLYRDDTCAFYPHQRPEILCRLIS